MIKCVVFDFDGTLADSKAVFIEIYNELARKSGYTLMTPDNIEQLRAMSISERCRYLNVPMYKIPFIIPKFLKLYKGSVPLLEFCSGADKMLGSLSEKNIPVAVISTNAKQNISEFFSLRGIKVDDIFCSSRLHGKDAVIRKFLKAKKLLPTEILYVGDEARDIIACRKIGVKVAWVSWGYDSAKAIENTPPDYIINAPEELVELVEALR
jgi:phosphoglycolate phosphatase